MASEPLTEPCAYCGRDVVFKPVVGSYFDFSVCCAKHARICCARCRKSKSFEASHKKVRA